MKLILPLSVTLPRKKGPDKVWILNLNSYRNTHFQILNQVKAAYRELVIKAACGCAIPTPPCHFVYTVYPGSNRKFDLENVCAVVGKFTADALVEIGIIPDDNFKVINKITYQFGAVDKENPRVTLEVI